MPTLPWTPASTDAAPTESIVLGSRLRLRSYRDVPGFLRAAMRVRAQVRETPGAIGVSLIAQPLRKTFWTLSAWTDRESLDAFVGAPPHVGVMSEYRGRLIDPLFDTWTVTASDIPKKNSNAKALWQQAKRRLAETKDGANT